MKFFMAALLALMALAGPAKAVSVSFFASVPLQMVACDSNTPLCTSGVYPVGSIFPGGFAGTFDLDDPLSDSSARFQGSNIAIGQTDGGMTLNSFVFIVPFDSLPIYLHDGYLYVDYIAPTAPGETGQFLFDYFLFVDEFLSSNFGYDSLIEGLSWDQGHESEAGSI